MTWFSRVPTRELSGRVRAHKHTGGFTLIETVVALSVLMLFFTAVALILQTVLRTVAENRVRIVALALAQEKLETAKNLPYVDLGTVGGIPAGVIPQDEYVTVNGQEFLVRTTITYVDDPFDGSATSEPPDTITNDYKRVRVAVKWEGAFAAHEFRALLTDVAPKGIETAAGGGTLAIRVLDAYGSPVQNAKVSLQAEAVVPPVDLELWTDPQGWIILPGALACFECYRISATKSGYSTDRTYGTEEVANPLKPHVTVLEGQVSQLSLSIDHVSTVEVTTTRSRESGYAPFQGVQFTLRGAKVIGTDTLDDPVYKYETSFVSGVGGKVTVSDLEWDIYEIFFPTTSTIDFAGSNPLNHFSLAPGTTIPATVVTTADTANSLLVSVTDGANNLLADATITLATTSATATKAAGSVGAGDQGQAYFGSLLTTTYDLIASLAGYLQATASVTILGDTVEQVILSASE